MGCTNVSIIIISAEYCLSDTFDPKCDSGAIVVMQQAQYGRMRIGRCVQMDRGALGCYSDELSTFDSLCSGQETCEVGIYDESKITTQLSCLNELKPYLEANYICQKGNKYTIITIINKSLHI